MVWYSREGRGNDQGGKGMGALAEVGRSNWALTWLT